MIEDIDRHIGEDEEDDNILEDSLEKDASHSRPTLKEVIDETAREDEPPSSSSFTLRKILGGDILNTATIRKQIWLILLITVFVVLYISNRYSCQQKQLEIDKLTTKLNNYKFKTLSTSSMLTEKSRESHVLEMLRVNNDSTIHTADQPPYIIMVGE